MPTTGKWPEYPWTRVELGEGYPQAIMYLMLREYEDEFMIIRSWTADSVIPQPHQFGRRSRYTTGCVRTFCDGHNDHVFASIVR